ncbi:unnamed protein product [Phaedon cochleariae]|uniref:Uncharacterized protein n=1 Tax=Phaedon cochleariae TaxID=80249 RepID=A0A9N9SDN6_PHACE|nr:unnamed protein product [Phaedon cochleariae]
MTHKSQLANMADENEEAIPKTDSKENTVEEDQPDTEEQQPEEPPEEPQSEEPQGPPEEPQAPPEEQPHDGNQEEQTENTALEPQAEGAPADENIVEVTDEVPEMVDRKSVPSRERSFGKSNSTLKVPKRSQDSGALRPSRELSRRGNKEGLSSRAKIVVGDVIDIRRSDLAGDVCDRRPAKYMNSYVMSSQNPFNPEKVMKIMKTVMEEAMAHLSYDPQACNKQAKWASASVRSKVRQLNYHRYKIVSVVTIGEKHSQDIFSTCRFLWDAEKDRYSSYVVENTNVYGIGLCFGMYYE